MPTDGVPAAEWPEVSPLLMKYWPVSDIPKRREAGRAEMTVSLNLLNDVIGGLSTLPKDGDPYRVIGFMRDVCDELLGRRPSDGSPA